MSALHGKATRMANVTPSDSTNLTNIATVGLYIGGSGDVAVVGVGGGPAVTLKSVPVGTFIDGSFSRVMATNTTATLIVAFYGYLGD